MNIWQYRDVLHQKTTTLTDAQIRALHASPVVLVNAPGANKLILPISIVLLADFPTPYNAPGDFAELIIGCSTVPFSASEAADSLVAMLWNSDIDNGNDTYLTRVLTNYNTTTTHLTRLIVGQANPRPDMGLLAQSMFAKPITSFTNRALFIRFNKGSTEITGGSTSNTLTVTVTYTTYDLGLKEHVV